MVEPVPYPLAKRLLDRTVAGALLLVSVPAIAAIVGAMGVDKLACRRDRGPLFYRERRISRGREFELLKFRTLRQELLDREGGLEGHARVFEGDPDNLTWAGRRILKPWYLDELPQLVNVLRGDMSLVGPRPWPLPLVREQLAAGLDYRNRIVAGWTGPAQVHKGIVESAAYTQLDLDYVRFCEESTAAEIVRRDLGLLWRTVKVLARGEGLRF